MTILPAIAYASLLDHTRGQYQQVQLSSQPRDTQHDADTNHLIHSIYAQTKPTHQLDFDLTYIRNPDRLFPFNTISIQNNHVLLEMPPTGLWPVEIELAMVAHETSHIYHYHRIKLDFYTATSTLLSSQWLWRTGMTIAPALTAGLCLGLILNRYLSRHYEYEADKDAVVRSPSTALEMQQCLQQSSQQLTSNSIFNRVKTLFSTHPSNQSRLTHLEQQGLFTPPPDKKLAFTQTTVLRLRHALLAKENMIVDSTRRIQNPYAHYLCHPDHDDALAQRLTAYCNASYTRYIIKEDEAALRQFYNLTKRLSTPLGKLYQTLSFEQFIDRLETKKFAAAYLSGGLLKARDPHDALGKQLDQQGTSWRPSINDPLLRRIGTSEDSDKLYESYLSLEEIALSSLLIDQALSLPLGTGSRDYETIDEPNSDELRFTWDARQQLKIALPQLITLSMPAGIECRDGATCHPDLWMVALPENPSADFKQLANRFKDNTFMQTARHLYGHKTALDVDLKTAKKDHDFTAIKSTNGKTWYLCKPAYKHRCKQILKQQLLAADHHMQQYTLGTTYQLKGMGLGAYGFSQAQPLLEQLYIEALEEVITETALRYIKTICLINLPSKLTQATPSEPMEKNINHIKIIERMIDPLAKHAIDGLIGGSHACGDRAAQQGNEFNAGIGPASSDDPATLHSVYHPCLRGKQPKKMILLETNAQPQLQSKESTGDTSLPTACSA